MPIPFTCPHCGSSTQVDDRYAGQTGPCAKCGQTITVPGAAGTVAPTAPRTGSPARSSGMTGIVIALVAVGALALLCLVGIGAAMFPAINQARSAATRTQCQNNLKQIGLALHNYHDSYGTLPPQYILGPDGRPWHSWRVMILPFLEQQALFNQYDFNEPWDGPNNSRLASLMPQIFVCPGDEANAVPGSTTTDYVVVDGAGHLFNGTDQNGFAQVMDGTSNTIAVVEMHGAGVNWMEPRDINFAQFQTAAGAHEGGSNVLMMDGSVHFIPQNAAVPQLFTKADGQAVYLP